MTIRIRANQILTCALLCALAPVAVRCPGQTPPIEPKQVNAPTPPAVALPPPPSVPADVPLTPITAAEAAQIALHHQPNVFAAQAQLQAARGVTEQQRSYLYPTLGVNGGYTYSDQFSGASGTGAALAIGGWSDSVEVHQLVFDFNRTLDLAQQAASLQRAAGYNLSAVQLSTVYLTKQAFYNYRQDVSLVEVAAANVRDAQAHLDLAQARLRSGLGLPSDVLQAQTQLDSSIVTLETDRQTATIARVTLSQLMGIDPRTPIDVSDTPELAPPPNDVNGYVGTSLAKRPEIQSEQEQIRAARYGVASAKTGNLPSLNATVGVTGFGQKFVPEDQFFEAGIAITWTPWDSGLTHGRVTQAQAQVLSAQAALQTATLQVVSDVSQAWVNLQTAEQRESTATIEVANAEENLRLAEGQYRAGVGIFLNVIDAQGELLTARNDEVIARAAIDQARAQLSYAIGLGV